MGMMILCVLAYHDKSLHLHGQVVVAQMCAKYQNDEYKVDFVECDSGYRWSTTIGNIFTAFCIPYCPFSVTFCRFCTL